MTVNLTEIPDHVLADELRRRGWRLEPPMPPSLDLESFERLLKSTIALLDQRRRNLGLVPIPEVRRQLNATCPTSAEAFDRMVLELAARRAVYLVPHDQPSRLPPEERSGCIQDPALGQVYYWFRWRM